MAESVIIALVVGVVGLILALCRKLTPFLTERRRQDSLLQNMPSPPSYPLLGNLPQLSKATGNPSTLFTTMSQELGSVFKLRLGPASWMIVVNDYDSVYEVLVKHGTSFAGRSGNYRSEIFSGKAGLIAMDYSAPKVKLLRSLAMSSIKPFGPGKGKLERLAMEMTQEFLEVFAKSDGASLDPYSDMHCAAIRMLSLMIFGEKYDVDSYEFNTIKEVTTLVNWCVAEQGSGILLDIFPWLRFFGNSVYKKMKQATEMSKAFSRNVIEEAMRRMGDGEGHYNVKPLLQCMLEQNRDSKEYHLNEDDIRVLTFQLQMAGILTTSSTLYALFNILLHHPNVQENIHREIDERIGEKALELNDQAKLPYTWATILEVLRYTSISPIAIPHKAVEDVSILNGRFTIPHGALVVPNLWTVHYDKRFWGDPQNFRPERFIDDDGQLLPVEHPKRRHVLAFGAGPRGCVGETFARARLFLWSVAIFQRFKLERPSPNEALIPCEPASYETGLVLLPQRYKLRFIPRNA